MMPAKPNWIWFVLLIAIALAVWFRLKPLDDNSSKATEPTQAMFITGGNGDFWRLSVKGAEAAAADYDVDLSVKLLDNAEGVREQMQILMGLLEQPLDGCAISSLDADGQTFLINQLAEKMDVVTFDSDAPMSYRRYYIGTSNYLAGQLCNELVKEALPDGGKILVLVSNLTKNNMIHRKAGYEVNNAADKWQTVSFLPDEGNKEKAIENIRNALKEDESLACIVGMNGYHGPLLRATLAELGQLGKVKLVTFDESEETLKGVEKGEIYATIVQDPWKYGYEAVRMLAILKNGNPAKMPLVGRGEINIRCEPIRQKDVQEFRTKLKQQLGKG